MKEKVFGLWERHRGVVLVTFEIFWIVVFLLEQLGQGAGGGIPQFVYVNF